MRSGLRSSTRSNHSERLAIMTRHGPNRPFSGTVRLPWHVGPSLARSGTSTALLAAGCPRTISGGIQATLFISRTEAHIH
jgi:hypothetical protein